MIPKQTYEEFLNSLDIWGSHILLQQRDTDQSPSFFRLLRQSIQNADHGVFSPFLYTALAAHLEKEEILLLAAALSCTRNKKLFTRPVWQLFMAGEHLADTDMDVFYHSAPLLFEREVNEDGQMSVCITARVFLFLQGILKETVFIPGMSWYHKAQEPLMKPGRHICIYENIAACLRNIPSKKLVYLKGEEGSGRRLNYACLAEGFGMGLAIISHEMLRTESQLREIRIECLLNHALFAIKLPKEDTDITTLLHWLEDEETVFLLGGQKDLKNAVSYERQYLTFAIAREDVLKDKEWFEALTCCYQWESNQDRLDFLGRYNFLPGKMREILELAKSYSLCANTDRIGAGQLKQAILSACSHSLDQYAKKINSIYRMQDLIIPDTQKQKLVHIIKRVQNKKLVYEEWGFSEKSAYGNGVSMIFAGPPGTGKTMAAQAMALELGMELYRVELPSVVDKYIGETEKKLNRIFSEAEKSMAILFFDEADVLFSKRTEIKESNDKYNNMEIAFLLQKMEEYEGVSILATNYLQNFDSAFRRRISDIIDFPLPDANLRKQMWQSMLPQKLPVSDEIDFCFLSEQFELSGSMIKNTLIYAGFLAAEAKEPLLTMERILKGLSHELEKSGKKLSRMEYGEYGHLF